MNCFASFLFMFLWDALLALTTAKANSYAAAN